jgi:hypothetical protein
MSATIDLDPATRAYDALEDMLEVQRRLMEAGREMTWLVQRSKTASASERPRLRAQLDELAAILTEHAAQISELAARYKGSTPRNS